MVDNVVRKTMEKQILLISYPVLKDTATGNLWLKRRPALKLRLREAHRRLLRVLSKKTFYFAHVLTCRCDYALDFPTQPKSQPLPILSYYQILSRSYYILEPVYVEMPGYPSVEHPSRQFRAYGNKKCFTYNSLIR